MLLRRRKTPNEPQILMDIRMPSDADPAAIGREIAFAMGGLAPRPEPETSVTLPTVGAIVHYQSYGTPGGEYTSQCRAAIVTEVGRVEVNENNPEGDGTFRATVGLCVLNPEGLFLNRGVLHDDDPDHSHLGGTWHWPEPAGE